MIRETYKLHYDQTACELRVEGSSRPERYFSRVLHVSLIWFAQPDFITSTRQQGRASPFRLRGPASRQPRAWGFDLNMDARKGSTGAGSSVNSVAVHLGHAIHVQLS